MKSKRIIALMATLLMGATTISAFSGCGGEEIIDSNYDASKAALTVGTYAGGVGKAWLEDAADRFEAAYATKTFGGKTGVQITVLADKVEYGGENLREKPLKADVYFTEGVNYYTFVDRNKAADITDIVTGTLDDFGETGKTIESKLDGAYKNFLKSIDGKYYMLPFYDGFYGFVYDVDLFEEAGLYFDDDGDFLDGLEKGASDTDKAAFEASKSNGPDGKDGTYDDGLPATYAQMIELADEIVRKGYMPFCYSGSTEYVDKAFRSYIVDYEGYDQMLLNYTLNGTANLVTSVENGVAKTEKVAITPDNAYELQKQAGKYYALSMEEQLFGSTKYIGSKNTWGHTETQRKFINSKYDTTGGKRYAILAEGVWWENEAEEAFKEIEKFNEKKSDRRFSFMPVPKANADIHTEQTMISLNSSYGFINKDSKNMDLAKEFMRFLHTDSEMSKFSAKTSIPRSLNYSVLPEDRDTATHFGKSLIDMRSNAKVIYPYSSAPLVLKNASAFEEVEWFATTQIDKKYVSPMKVFQAGEASAEEYFNGLYTYQKSRWGTLTK